MMDQSKQIPTNNPKLTPEERRRYKSKGINSNTSRNRAFSSTLISYASMNNKTIDHLLLQSLRKEEKDEKGKSVYVPSNMFLSNYHKAIAICNDYFVRYKISNDNTMEYKAKLIAKLKIYFSKSNRLTLFKEVLKYIDFYIEKELSVSNTQLYNKRALDITLSTLKHEIGLTRDDNNQSKIFAQVTIQSYKKGSEAKSRSLMKEDEKRQKKLFLKEEKANYYQVSSSKINNEGLNNNQAVLKKYFNDESSFLLNTFQGKNSLSTFKFTDSSFHHKRSKSNVDIIASKYEKETQEKNMRDLLQSIIYQNQSKKLKSISVNKSASSHVMSNSSITLNKEDFNKKSLDNRKENHSIHKVKQMSLQSFEVKFKQMKNKYYRSFVTSVGKHPKNSQSRLKSSIKNKNIAMLITHYYIKRKVNEIIAILFRVSSAYNKNIKNKTRTRNKKQYRQKVVLLHENKSTTPVFKAEEKNKQNTNSRAVQSIETDNVRKKLIFK